MIQNCFEEFTLPRADILQMTDELKDQLEHSNRKGALPPVFASATCIAFLRQWLIPRYLCRIDRHGPVTVATSWVAFTCRVTKPFSMPTVRRLSSAGIGVRVRKGKSRYRPQCRRPAMHSFSWGMHPMTSRSAGNTRYGHSCTKASQV